MRPSSPMFRRYHQKHEIWPIFLKSDLYPTQNTYFYRITMSIDNSHAHNHNHTTATIRLQFLALQTLVRLFVHKTVLTMMETVLAQESDYRKREDHKAGIRDVQNSLPDATFYNIPALIVVVCMAIPTKKMDLDKEDVGIITGVIEHSLHYNIYNYQTISMYKCVELKSGIHIWKFKIHHMECGCYTWNYEI